MPSTTRTPSTRSPEDRAKAQAKAEADAKATADATRRHLESLNEDDRAEYLAAARDLYDAMEEIGARGIHTCYRGAPPEGHPEGVRTVEEMRFHTTLLRSVIPSIKAQNTESSETAEASTLGDTASGGSRRNP
ncbi:hypothetical protein GS481_02815 [Rhodococcus hoagii]|nr:hypothetical protein [Prescottella equi]